MSRPKSRRARHIGGFLGLAALKLFADDAEDQT